MKEQLKNKQTIKPKPKQNLQTQCQISRDSKEIKFIKKYLKNL